MMRPTVTLPSAVRRALVAHADRERPRECCGLLLGRGRRVQFAVPVRNQAAGVTRYELDPRAHIDVRRTVRAFVPAMAIVGVYHSHPEGLPDPSPTDIAEAAYPEWVYVIVGRRGARPRIAAYRIRRGRVARLAVRSDAR
jgi:proteasome lid subunit RPN8/RPN11